MQRCDVVRHRQLETNPGNIAGISRLFLFGVLLGLGPGLGGGGMAAASDLPALPLGLVGVQGDLAMGATTLLLPIPAPTAAARLLSLSGWLLLPISTTSAPPLVTCRNSVLEMVRAFFW